MKPILKFEISSFIDENCSTSSSQFTEHRLGVSGLYGFFRTQGRDR